MKLRTKIMLLVFCVVAAILLLNQYPVSMSMRQSLIKAEAVAMQDILYVASTSSELIDGILQEDSTALKQQADVLEACKNCSGVAIVDSERQVLYNSEAHGIEESVLQEYTAMLPAKPEYHVVNQGNMPAVTYICHPVYDDSGNLLGAIVSKLIDTENHSSIQKAQRDLNAMTLLVMLIALIFVWDLTDNITGTMFNLEPVEIAQLLVERNGLIDAVRDGILSIDQNGKLIHVNRTALELLRRASVEYDPAACEFSQLFPHLSFSELMQNDRPCYDSECTIGTDVFYSSFIPIRIEKPQHNSLLVTFRPKQDVVRFAEDITGVRSYIEALRAQMHEFNNKLQVMSGLVQGKKYVELEEYLFALVRLRNREIEEVSRKVKDPILAAFLMSKYDRAAEQHVDLILTDRTQFSLTLPNTIMQDLVVIIGNLLENAFDAVQGCDMQTVTLELTESTGLIRVYVWNSGPEIPVSLRERLFDYGVTTKPNGNGIGLHLVQQACMRNNGYITVSSDSDDGTEFTAYLSYVKGEETEHVPSADC